MVGGLVGPLLCRSANNGCLAAEVYIGSCTKWEERALGSVVFIMGTGIICHELSWMRAPSSKVHLFMLTNVSREKLCS